MEYTVCDNCPCFNNDYEYGESCNLGFDTVYHKTNMGWFYLSVNCKMVKVVTENSEYVRNKHELEIVENLVRKLSNLDELMSVYYNKKIKDVFEFEPIFKKLSEREHVCGNVRGNIDRIKIGRMPDINTTPL